MPKYRLYFYNSHDGGKTFVYDTGVFDSDAPKGQGCLNPDPMQLANLQQLAEYARGRGEILQQVGSVEEVNRICSGALTNAPVVAPPPAQQPPPPGPYFRGDLTVTTQTVPSLTPGPPGTVTANQTTAPPPGVLYRFFLESAEPYHRYDTGATYPACNRANPEGCQPRQFTSMSDLLSFARTEGSTVIRANSEDEVWSMIEGQTPIDPSRVVSSDIGIMGMGLGMIALLAAGFAFTGRKKKS
jgi:hypothetical protein